MKLLKWVFPFFVFFPVFIFAQCSENHLFFSGLTTNTNVHYRGLAEIGVVSSASQQSNIAWKENPALLGSQPNTIAVESNLLAFRSFPFKSLINLNGQLPLSPRLVLGLDATYLSYDTSTDIIISLDQPTSFYEYHLTSSLGFRLNEHFFLGGGLTFLESSFHKFRSNFETNLINSFAWHLGVHYKGKKQLTNYEKLTMEGGLSVTNFGSRISNPVYFGVQKHLPATLQLGGMVGWKTKLMKGAKFGINLLAQIDHDLFPDCSFRDDDNNGVADYLEFTSFEAAFQSFGDHPNGFKGELESMIKRIALKPWIEISNNLEFGIGIGYVNGKNDPYVTTGLNVRYRNYQLDFSKGGGTSFAIKGTNVWAVSLRYSKTIKKGSSES